MCPRAALTCGTGSPTPRSRPPQRPAWRAACARSWPPSTRTRLRGAESTTERAEAGAFGSAGSTGRGQGGGAGRQGAAPPAPVARRRAAVAADCHLASARRHPPCPTHSPTKRIKRPRWADGASALLYALQTPAAHACNAPTKPVETSVGGGAWPFSLPRSSSATSSLPSSRRDTKPMATQGGDPARGHGCRSRSSSPAGGWRVQRGGAGRAGSGEAGGRQGGKEGQPGRLAPGRASNPSQLQPQAASRARWAHQSSGAGPPSPCGGRSGPRLPHEPPNQAGKPRAIAAHPPIMRRRSAESLG